MILTSQTYVDTQEDLHYEFLEFREEGGMIFQHSQTVTVDRLVVGDVSEDTPQFTFTTQVPCRAGEAPRDGTRKPCAQLIIKELEGDLRVVDIGAPGGNGGDGGDGEPGADVLVVAGSGCGGAGAHGGNGGDAGDGGDGPDLDIRYASTSGGRIGVSVRRAEGGKGGKPGKGGPGGRNWDGSQAPSGEDGKPGRDGTKGKKGCVRVNGKRVLAEAEISAEAGISAEAEMSAETEMSAEAKISADPEKFEKERNENEYKFI